MMKNIILLSFYNGAEYIEKQIISIIKSARSFDVTIVTYDDFSEDDSLKILKNFQDKIDIVFLGNKKLNHVSRNFIYLLEFSLNKFGRNNIYYFCDQDDIWDEKKVAITNKLLLESNSPLLLSGVKHFGNKNTVLIPNINRFFILDLFFNVAPGMSYAFVPSRLNKDISLIKLFKWHDHGLFLISRIFGPAPLVSTKVLQYYRRHGNSYMSINKFNFSNRFSYFWSNLNALIKIFFR